ncbi:hypothetical protein [Sphingomonas sp.]
MIAIDVPMIDGGDGQHGGWPPSPPPPAPAPTPTPPPTPTKPNE